MKNHLQLMSGRRGVSYAAILASCLLLASAISQAQQTDVCDVDFDQDIDRYDIAAIASARNQPAGGPDDPRDPDRDLQITVNDARICTQSCTLAQCAVPAPNQAPTADAGADQAVFTGAVVALNGSGSSDADGDALTFRWTLRARPAASSAALSDSTAVTPGFVADLDGRYDVDLIVNDGRVDSPVDTVIVTTMPANNAPIAHAGPDQDAVVGEQVIVDGSLSSDVDGDLLSFEWTLVSAPAGSTATLGGADEVQASFVPDMAGAYSLRLTVDDGRGGSASDTVEVLTEPGNAAPIADAGLDQVTAVGAAVVLDGGASSDADGDPLSFRWSFITRPAGSAASLQNATTAAPGFTPDREGDYVVQLIVNDGVADSAPDTVLISSGNTPPVADAGADQSVTPGDFVQLDGSASSDANGDSLAFFWSVISRPAGSVAALTNAATPTPSLQVDAPGLFVVQLIVNDGAVDSAPDTMTITVEAPAPTVTVVTTDGRAGELGPDAGAFTISRSGDSSAALTVNYSMTGPATNGVDYQALSGVVTIPAGAASADVTVMPVADADVEGTETVVLSLSPAADYVVGVPGLAALVITDSVVVSIEASDASASEASLDPATFVISRAGDDLAQPLVVRLARSGAANNPLFPDDTNFIAIIATIPAGQASVVITATPVRDNLVEGAEDLTLTLAANAAYVIGSPDRATITIADDPPVVVVSATDALGAEAGRDPGVFAFTRSGGNIAAALTARCAFSGSAGSSSDYVFTGCSAVIAANETFGVLTITPQQDNRVEGDETVVATLISSTNYEIGLPAAATIAITDDPAIVSIAATDAQADEGGDPGAFTLTRIGGDLSEGLAVIVTRGGTATNTADYVLSGAGIVVIPANQTAMAISVDPVDDPLVEEEETVTLRINASDRFIIEGPGSATVAIVDNDSRGATQTLLNTRTRWR